MTANQKALSEIYCRFICDSYGYDKHEQLSTKKMRTQTSYPHPMYDVDNRVQSDKINKLSDADVEILLKSQSLQIIMQ